MLLVELAQREHLRLCSDFAGVRIELSATDGAAVLSLRSKRGGGPVILRPYRTQQGLIAASIPVCQGLGGGPAVRVRYAAPSVVHDTSALCKERKEVVSHA